MKPKLSTARLASSIVAEVLQAPSMPPAADPMSPSIMTRRCPKRSASMPPKMPTSIAARRKREMVRLACSSVSPNASLRTGSEIGTLPTLAPPEVPAATIRATRTAWPGHRSAVDGQPPPKTFLRTADPVPAGSRRMARSCSAIIRNSPDIAFAAT